MKETLNIEIPILELLKEHSAYFYNLIKEELKINTNANESPLFYTRKETAKLLSISLPTLNDYTKRGLIIANRLGRRVLYTKSNIENALITNNSKL